LSYTVRLMLTDPRLLSPGLLWIVGQPGSVSISRTVYQFAVGRAHPCRGLQPGFPRGALVSVPSIGSGGVAAEFTAPPPLKSSSARRRRCSGVRLATKAARGSAFFSGGWLVQAVVQAAGWLALS